MEIGYIYTITNKVSGKVYVGQAKDFRDRWARHKRELRGNYHNNTHLQNSYNKYGATAFEYKVIAEVPLESISEAEMAYITQYDSFNNGYNLTLGGEGIRGLVHTEEAIRSMTEKSRARWNDADFIARQKQGYSDEVREIMSSKKVGEKHPQAKLTNEARLNIYKDIYKSDSYWAEKYNITKATVSLIRTGQRSGKLTKTLNDEGFYHPLHLRRLGKDYSAVKPYAETVATVKDKPLRVLQISATTNEVVKIWDSVEKASEETSFTSNGITRCCKGVAQTYKGWKWKYEGAE
jgi:group I intron endonuclease